MNSASERPPGAASEHRAVTLGDLAALVTGIALVMVLPSRQSNWPHPTDFLGPWPKWLPWIFCLRQALGASCVVLVPVVLWRRACYGGLARPAEFLALCAGMPFLADSIEIALIRQSYRVRTGQALPGSGLEGIATSFTSQWSEYSHWLWQLSLLLLAALALAAFLIGRRKLPGWLLTTLLIGAWLGAYEAGVELAEGWIFALILRITGQPMGEMAGVLLFAVVGHLPRFVLYTVPAIAAIRDVRRAGPPRPTWLEWTSLCLAAALFLVAESTEVVRIYSVAGPGESWAVETLVRAVTLLAALGLGYFFQTFLIARPIVSILGRMPQGAGNRPEV
jgi:hypothetical protein